MYVHPVDSVLAAAAELDHVPALGELSKHHMQLRWLEPKDGHPGLF